MTRSQDGIAYTIDTSDLEPTAVHTVWVVVFNNPEHCVKDPCGAQDLPPFGGDPAIEASAFWDLGRITDEVGQATFNGHVIAGEPAPGGAGQTLFGDGLHDARKAEVHFILRSHGPIEPLIDADMLDGALATGNIGCGTLMRFDGTLLEVGDGPNACTDVQSSVHAP